MFFHIPFVEKLSPTNQNDKTKRITTYIQNENKQDNKMNVNEKET
jgi:hypothetical protein